MCVTTIGLDLAKNLFQVHGVDADGQIVLRRKLRRSEILRFFEALPGCLVGIEACATPTTGLARWPPLVMRSG
jgi:transposase